MKKYLIIAIAVLGLLSVKCKKKQDPPATTTTTSTTSSSTTSSTSSTTGSTPAPNSWEMLGDSFNGAPKYATNQVVSMYYVKSKDSLAHFNFAAGAIDITIYDEKVKIGDETDTVTMNIHLTAKNPGIWTVNTDQYMNLEIVSTKFGKANYAAYPGNASIRLLKFEGVGGKVEGTFTGTFWDSGDKHHFLNIKNGKFSTLRGKDS